MRREGACEDNDGRLIFIVGVKPKDGRATHSSSKVVARISDRGLSVRKSSSDKE